MKCDSCGAPIENGKCTYCGKVFENNRNEQQPNDAEANQERNANPQPNPQPNPPKVPTWKQTWFVTLMCLFMPYIGVLLLWAAKKPSSVFLRIIISIFLVAFSVNLFSSLYETELALQDENGSVWLEGYTDINNFKYYIDEDEIFLTDYQAAGRKIRINSSYEIEGNIYNVVSLDGVFTSDRVTSVIIPEGVRSIAINEFSGTGVKYLYLPSTLQDIENDSFWSYFHDAEKIYYGGTKEQWKQLCTVERAEIDVTQIIYGANPDDLK